MDKEEARRVFFDNWKTISAAAWVELGDNFETSAGHAERIDAAHDLAIETLKTIWKIADQYDPARAAFKTWASGIARRKAKNFKRSYWRARSVPLPGGRREFFGIYSVTDWDAPAPGREEKNDEGEPISFDERVTSNLADDEKPGDEIGFDEYARRAERDAFEGALVQEFAQDGGELTEEYKQVAQLIYVNGLSDKDTAQALGVPLGTVKSRLFRANKIIKRIQKRAERKLYASPFKGVEIGKRGPMFAYFLRKAPCPALPARQSRPARGERCKHGMVKRSCWECTPGDWEPGADLKIYWISAYNSREPFR